MTQKNQMILLAVLVLIMASSVVFQSHYILDGPRECGNFPELPVTRG